MVSVVGRAAVNAQQTDEVFLVLLMITHPSIPTPLRFVNDYQNCTSGGQVYTAFPFKITFPESGGTTLGQATLTIDNVDLSISEAVQNIFGPPVVTLTVVLASSPDTIEWGPFSLYLRQVTVTALTVEGTLYYEDILNEPFPAGTFDPKTAPGLLSAALETASFGGYGNVPVANG